MKLFTYVPRLLDCERVPMAVLVVGRRQHGQLFGFLRIPTPLYDWETDVCRCGWNLGFRWLHVCLMQDLPVRSFLEIINPRVFRPFTGDF